MEVLKGPQGTLYGRNATAGAINVLSNKPTSEFGGHDEVEAGDYNLFGVRGVLNAPIIEGAQRLNHNFITRRSGDLFNPSTDTPDHNVFSKAMFGQATINVSDKAGLTAGLRYTTDEKSEHSISRRSTNGAPPVIAQGSHRANRDSIDWYPFEDTLVYGNISTGYKSSGFSSVLAQITNGLTFDPEEFIAYLVGHKSQLVDLNNLEDEMVWSNGRLSGSGVRQVNGRPPMMYGLRVNYSFGS